MYTLGQQDHALLVVPHHAITDVWSNVVLLDDFKKLYSAAVCHEQASLEPLEVQFGDYAAWEKTYGDPDRAQYWRSTLRSPPTRLPLSINQMSLGADRGYLSIPRATPDVSPAITRLLLDETQACHTSLATAICAVVVSSWARSMLENEMIFGLLDANRDRKELRNVVGFIAQVIPIRVRFTPKATFRDVLVAVRDAIHEAYDKRMPFGYIHNVMGAMEALSWDDRYPFDVIVNTLPALPPTIHNLPGRHGHSLRLDIWEPMVRLAVDGPHRDFGHLYYLIAPTDRDGLEGTIYGNERVFRRAELARLGEEFVDSLRLAVLHPDWPIRQTL